MTDEKYIRRRWRFLLVAEIVCALILTILFGREVAAAFLLGCAAEHLGRHYLEI